MAGYLALYRKHRSRSLDDIVGQEHITKTIKNALKHGKISHAYLFTGPRGVGKTSVARILAHEINELPYDPLKTPPVDIIEIDAASNRRIDEIRDLREKIHISPTSSKYKVYIVDEVHMLTKEAFNALLKTLEEPPSHVIFILATTESHKLPETIISRTQQYSFKPISVALIAEHLSNIAKIEGINIDQNALELIAKHGNGSFRDSISMLDQIRSIASNTKKISPGDVQRALGLAPAQLIESLIDAVFTGQSSDVLHLLHSLIDRGVASQQIAMQCMSYLQTSIQNGDQNIDVSSGLNLLDNLMGVSVSNFPDLKLQTVLLRENLNANQTSDVTVEEITPKISNVKQAKKAVNNSSNADSKQVKKVAKQDLSSNLDPDIWNDVLSDIKKHNNPLYAILRLAKVESKNGSIMLGFKFPFHQQRVNEQKNMNLIRKSLQTHIASEIQIETSVDENHDIKLPERIPDIINADSNDPKISAIIDIMGGGEVVTNV